MPRLADGVELLGEYEGSGFKEPPYLARRADGQVVRLSRLLYLVALHADGRRTAEQIAERASREFGRPVIGENVEFLVEKKLRPLGVLAQADGSSPDLPRASPFLALTFRMALVPQRLVSAISAFLWPLFLPPVVVAVLLGLAVLDAWLFFAHGLGESVREILYRPEMFLMVSGLAVLSGVFHEFGHAAACRYGGARPSVIGVGIYLVWPVFYSDVTDTYRLGKIGRLRTDLGGVYFNAIFSLVIVATYFITGVESLLIVILLQQIAMLHQFLPFLRLDGYYVVSDLTGVPDLFGRIKPILRTMVPGRGTDEGVEELKPWVRVVVAAWVLMVIPALLCLFAVLAVSAPMIFATAWDSIVLHYGEVRAAFGVGRVADGAAGLLRMALLVIPVAGIILTFALVGKRLGLALLNWPRSKDDTLARNETLVGLYFRDLCSRRNLNSADEIIAPDCTLHNSGFPEVVRGLEGLRRHIAARRDAIPEDASVTVEDKVADGDKVAVRWTYRSARDDESAVPNDGGATPTWVTSFRIADGKIAEIWKDHDISGELHTPDNTEKRQETLPSLRLIVGALSAYVGIPVVLLYPVSLVAFALQLLVSQHLGFLTAWYAASLVPATIIWGQAITVLLLPLCASFAVALATAHFRVWRQLEARKEEPRIEEESRRRTRRIRLSVAGVVLFLVAMVVVVLWFVPVPFFPGFASTLSLTLAVLVGWSAGSVIVDDYVRSTNRPERSVLLGKHWLWRGVEEGWIFRGLSWVYLGGGLGAIFSVLAVGAFGQGPDLPRAMIGSSGKGVETLNEAPPLLLSHSGGYWHTLNSGEGGGIENGRIEESILSSIPNSEAGDVVVIDDPVADLSLTLRGQHDDVVWTGTLLRYELKVTNNGPDTATDVELANSMPEDATTLVSATTSRGTCASTVAGDTRTVECEVGELPEEGTATVRIAIEPSATGNLSTIATIKSGGFDYNEVNSKEAYKIEAKLDTTAPEMRPTLLPKPNPRKWNNSDVIVNLEAEDHEGSGVGEIVYSANGAQEIEEKTVRGTSAELRIATEGKTTIYYSAKDIAGNTGEKASVIIGIDKTDPEVHCEKPDDLWHRTDVSIPCTTKDSISGLGELTDANFLLSTENARERIEDGEEGDSASTNSREICDAAGNCTMAGPIDGIKIDRKSPVIDIVAPPNDAEYKLTEHVEATYACIDSGSGVDECSVSAANGSAIDTSSVGSKSFIVKAKDNAGNSTSESHRYDVVYDFTSSGSVRLQDDPSGLYVAKAGSTVLVEFGLGGYRGSDVFAVGYPRSQNIECPEQGSQVSITESTAQFTKLPNADRYAYAWNTAADWSGTCRQLVLKLDDGTAHVANFRFTE